MAMPPGVSAKNFIGAGTSGMCFLYPGTNKVIKIPLTDEEEGDRCKIEIEAYERLQTQLNRPSSILTYYGKTKYGIEVAYASHRSIRQYRAKQGQIQVRLLYQWADEAAEAIAFCHAAHILHADISCRNFFIDDSLGLRLADFSGSSIDFKKPLIFYSSSHRRPSEGFSVATIQTEVFAFGSFLYELATGAEPAATNNGLEVYPDVTTVPLGAIMLGCWNGQYDDMLRVRQEITEEGSSLGKYCISGWILRRC
jgi:serine/threonine protein kinase